jgi:hypothetical protein
MDELNRIAALDQWADWGKAYAPSSSSLPDWSAVEFLIEAVQPRLMEDSKALRELLERSSDQLKFEDPLVCDLGLHRWLGKDREEAYSDWLAWVLQQFRDAEAVLRVLGVQDQEFRTLCSETVYRVEREAFVKEGAPDCEGRIDLLIIFGEPECALVGIEVKTWDENYDKQEGYVGSLKDRCEHLRCVLLAIPEVSQDTCGFELRLWRDVSTALRREVARNVTVQSGTIVAAMILGFVGCRDEVYDQFRQKSRACRVEKDGGLFACLDTANQTAGSRFCS